MWPLPKEPHAFPDVVVVKPQELGSTMAGVVLHSQVPSEPLEYHTYLSP